MTTTTTTTTTPALTIADLVATARGISRSIAAFKANRTRVERTLKGTKGNARKAIKARLAEFDEKIATAAEAVTDTMFAAFELEMAEQRAAEEAIAAAEAAAERKKAARRARAAAKKAATKASA